ncbi:hypothetical protein LUZ63_011472 [Rhynchospora breviuscula]|uniref:Growth-regulating factor n=1 Tax=Rhynchospora breviuscula TaxID=2022672 RepID=A0A9Q0CJV0_9POAL|nr:hypothetical protein LUZ63_011472 [Rhynchospora breviuscula]
MAEEGKITLEEKETEKEKEEEGTDGENSNPAPEVGEEKREEGEGTEGKEEENEGNNPTPGEEEKIGEEEAKEKNQSNEETHSDSVTVTVAATLPYADAVAGVKADFSFPQLQELEQQTLIYRYMAAAVPVPTHLVFPIWKSVTTSSSSSAGPEQYPTLMGLATLCLDFGKTPEPEPGRCRRTDGKKWRCWRNVVPDQKYCERHLHRGRKRPVPVEILDEPEDAMPVAVVAAVSVSAEKGTGEGSTSSKKSKKERVSKDADTQVAVPTTTAAVKSS